jgi:hypothetical protein
MLRPYLGLHASKLQGIESTRLGAPQTVQRGLANALAHASSPDPTVTDAREIWRTLGALKRPTRRLSWRASHLCTTPAVGRVQSK